MQNQHRPSPSADFVGGFHLPRTGAPEQQTVSITTPGVPDVQFSSSSQHDYQHPYFPEPGIPSEARPRAITLQTTYSYTRVHKTSHRSRKHGKVQSKPPGMPHPQYTSSGPSEPAAPPHYQVSPEYIRPSNFHAPVQPPRPEQKLAHSGSRVFHYSKCTGKKKALCIGINYTGTAKELNGCVNDAKNVCKFLRERWNFKSRDIWVLTDDTLNPKNLPTKANIINAMRWLVSGACANDSLFIHYSGHGGQIRDTDGDEPDGYDEVIFPLDYDRKGVGIISDDDMNELLVRPIPDGCRLTALFDSCHSGSALDLVYLYHSDGRLKSSPVSEKWRGLKSSAGDVISFSGCEDGKTSADVVKNGVAVGAMSYAFMKCLETNPKQSYQQLLKGVREILRKTYRQKPQLSSSHKIDINMRFVL